MTRPRCACVSADAERCYALRHGVNVLDLDRGERCECACHEEDEDGFSDWDAEQVALAYAEACRKLAAAGTGEAA